MAAALGDGPSIGSLSDENPFPPPIPVRRHITRIVCSTRDSGLSISPTKASQNFHFHLRGPGLTKKIPKASVQPQRSLSKPFKPFKSHALTNCSFCLFLSPRRLPPTNSFHAHPPNIPPPGPSLSNLSPSLHLHISFIASYSLFFLVLVISLSRPPLYILPHYERKLLCNSPVGIRTKKSSSTPVGRAPGALLLARHPFLV